MKYIFIFIVCVYPWIGYSQQSDATLRKACDRIYRSDTTLPKMCDLGDHPIDAEELFVNYFNECVVFGIHIGYCFPRLYCIDRKTCSRFDFRNDSTFFDIVNNANFVITNLDKCMLYLFAQKYYNGNDFSSMFGLYPDDLERNCVFRHKAHFLFGHWDLSGRMGNLVVINPPLGEEQYKADLRNSTLRHIIVYVLKYLDKNMETDETAKYRYHFYFNARNEMMKVSFELY